MTVLIFGWTCSLLAVLHKIHRAFMDLFWNILLFWNGLKEQIYEMTAGFLDISAIWGICDTIFVYDVAPFPDFTLLKSDLFDYAECMCSVNDISMSTKSVFLNFLSQNH